MLNNSVFIEQGYERTVPLDTHQKTLGLNGFTENSIEDFLSPHNPSAKYIVLEHRK